MKSRSVLGLAALAVVALAFAATANAGARWFWTKSYAREYILSTVTTSDGHSLMHATCIGRGTSWRPHGNLLFSKFTCVELDDVGRIFTVALTPVTRTRARVVEVDCDDSYAYDNVADEAVYCP